VKVVDFEHRVDINLSLDCSPNLDYPHHAIARIDVKEVFKGIVSVSAKDTEQVALSVSVIPQLAFNPIGGIRNFLRIRGSVPDACELVLCRRFHNNRVSHP
jgi:hypothetical protein